MSDTPAPVAAPAPAPAPVAPPAAPPPAPAPPVDSLLSAVTPPAADPPPGAPISPADSAKYVLKDRPDWLPEAFHDKATGEVKIEALAKSQADLRAKLGAGTHKAPKTADDYKLDGLDFGEEAESLKPTAARVLAKDDPVLKGMLGSFHKHGLSQDQVAGILGDYVRQAHEVLPPAFDPVAEKKALGPKADQILMDAVGFRDTLVKRGFITDADKVEFDIAFGTAGALKVFQAMREFYGEQPLTSRLAEAAASTPSADALRSEMASLMTDAQAGKPGAENRYNALMQKYEALYGKQPARTSAAAA